MYQVDSFYESIKIQQRFIKQLSGVPKDDIAGLIDHISEFILRPAVCAKVIYGIAEGRTALSLYDFLQQLSKFDNIFPVTLDDPIRRYIDHERKNIIIAATGSGETRSVLTYLDEAIRFGVPVILITAKIDSTAYKKVKNYDNGFAFVLGSIGEKDKKHLIALGSEFELKLAVLLNSVLPALYECTGKCDPSRYYKQIDHFMGNARLLSGIEPDHLDQWTDKVLNRRGNYIVDGVGRSGFVSKAFGMRLTHLGRNVFLRDGPTTPNFIRGDAYIPISGSGNTREIIDGAEMAKKAGSDIFPIIVNKNSRLTEKMREWGYEKNIMYIPLMEKDVRMYGDVDLSKIIAAKTVQARLSISEINTYLFTNSFISLSMNVLGVSEKYLQRIHKSDK
jgi:D-arabinose 5-phosphate isomerase GutQ